MAVSPVDSTSSAASAAAAAERIPQKTLGQQDFLKLLSAQLAAQDPLNPMSDTDFIAQMSSFSALESMSDVAKSMNTLIALQDFSSAQGLLGRDATVLDSGGRQVTGTVDSVHSEDDTTYITMDGTDYDVRSVIRIQLSGSNPSTDGN